MRFSISILAVIMGCAIAADRPAPGFIETSALKEFSELEPARQKLIKTSLSEASRLKLNQYLYGSADPSKQGFDCSGAMHYLLKKVGVSPPRSSAAQFEWIKKNEQLHEVPAGTRDLDHESFADLKPGDLLFWSGTYKPTDGRTNKITHVQMYLGREPDGNPVMIGSSDGRSYRRKARCGFGVFDFKLPGAKSKSHFVGYGTPPGLLSKKPDLNG